MNHLARCLGTLTLIVSISFPSSVLSQTVNRTGSVDRQNSMQVAQADPLDAVQASMQLAGEKWGQFLNTYDQYRRFGNSKQSVQTLAALISISEQSAQSQLQLVRNLRSALAFMPTQSLAFFTDYLSKHEAEKFATMVGWSQTLPKVRSAIQSNNQAALNQLMQGDVKVLMQRMSVHAETEKQIPQIWQQAKASNLVEMGQMIVNSTAIQAQGLADRGRAAKCMVSSLPYGSAAQVATNPTAFCNAP